MKRNKNYFSILGMVLACGVLITSCADNFDEEQILQDQRDRSDQIAQREADEKAADQQRLDELSAENAAALATASNVTYTISLHSDNVPAADVGVTLTNQNGGSTTSIVTDANGNAAFIDIDLGGYNVSIASDDHLDSSYLVDFGSPQDGVHYEWVDGSIVAMEQSEASKIELLELNGMQTATIKGKVEIETDLTNDTPEIPLGVTIRANLDDFDGLFEHTNQSNNGSNNLGEFYVSNSFSLTEGDIGSAEVNANTGEYSMQVPAQEGGTVVDLLIPLVEADQTLAFSSVDGQDVGAQVGTQAAVFGPDITANTPPTLGGVVAQFPEPEAPGRGFTVGNFERMPADLSVSEESYPISTFPLGEIPGSRSRGNQGSGYQLTPAVTVSAPDFTGPDAQNIEIEADMDWTFESVTHGDGVGYMPNQDIAVILQISDEGGVRNSFQIATIPASPMGIVSAGTVDVTLNQTFFTDYVVTSFTLIYPGPGNLAGGTLVRTGTVKSFDVLNDGEGYTSIPTITVEPAPNGGTDATLEIYEMAFKYSFDLDNSGITQGYVVLPEITFELENPPGFFNPSTSATFVHLDENGFIEDFTTLTPSSDVQNPLTNGLMVSNNGNLVFDDDQFGTNINRVRNVDKVLTGFSFSVPRAIIVDPTHEQTTADVNVNNDGEVTGLINISPGTGYTSEQDVTLVTLDGLSGTGAVLDLVDFNVNNQTGEVIWAGSANDVIVVNQGTGYTLDANIGRELFSAPTSINVKNGETKIVNINYGTGSTVSEVD